MATKTWSDLATLEKREAVLQFASMGWSYSEIARLLGTNRSAISGCLSRARRALIPQSPAKPILSECVSDQVLARIAAMFVEGYQASAIGSAVGLPGYRVERVISDARRNNDLRFQYRYTNEAMNASPPKPSEGDAAKTVYLAFKRERHPDGTPYTMRCVFAAHRSPSDGPFDPLAIVRAA